MLSKNSLIGGTADSRVPRRLAEHSSSIDSRNDSITACELKKAEIMYTMSRSLDMASQINAASANFNSLEAGMNIDSRMMDVLLESLNDRELNSRSISR